MESWAIGLSWLLEIGSIVYHVQATDHVYGPFGSLAGLILGLLAAGACKAIESFLSVRRIEDLTYRNTARPQSAQRFVCPRAAPPLDQIRIRQSSRARLCCASNSASACPGVVSERLCFLRSRLKSEFLVSPGVREFQSFLVFVQFFIS